MTIRASQLRPTTHIHIHSASFLPNRAIKNPGVSRRNLEANCGARRFLHVTSWPRESCIASSSALAEGLVSLQRAGEGRSTVAAGRVGARSWRCTDALENRRSWPRGSGTGKESCSDGHEKTRKAVHLAVRQYSLRSVIKEKVLDSFAAEAKPANFAIRVESVLWRRCLWWLLPEHCLQRAIVRVESSHVRGKQSCNNTNGRETALRFSLYSRLSLVYSIRG